MIQDAIEKPVFTLADKIIPEYLMQIGNLQVCLVNSVVSKCSVMPNIPDNKGLTALAVLLRLCYPLRLNYQDLITLRLALETTQPQLADILHTTRNTISRLERNIARMTPLLDKLFRFTGISILQQRYPYLPHIDLANIVWLPIPKKVPTYSVPVFRVAYLPIDNLDDNTKYWVKV